MGASAGVALATTRSSRATTGVEYYWVSGFSRTTGSPTVFVGTGLFTDAGRLTGANGDTVRLSQGTFHVNSSKIKASYKFNASTCFVTETAGGTVSLHGGTAAYAGISGTLSVSGKELAVMPRLKNGKCNEANSAVPLQVVGEFSGRGTVTLGS